MIFITTPLLAKAHPHITLPSFESYTRTMASPCAVLKGEDVLTRDECSRSPRAASQVLSRFGLLIPIQPNLTIAKIDNEQLAIPFLRMRTRLNSTERGSHTGSTQANGNGNGHGGFKWRSAINQYLLVLAVEHAFDLTQEKTRRELKGPFFKDYFRSVAGLGGWGDGGKFFTNYVAHPMEGSLYGFIQVQNDPKGKRQKFGRSKDYWISRLKAMGWSALCSAQFELGPLSQAAIGNVGLHTDHSGKNKRKMAYVDLVVTPTLGTAFLVGEDALDRYFLRRFDKMNNRILRNTIRTLLNPMRSSANIFRFKLPWHRDN